MPSLAHLGLALGLAATTVSAGTLSVSINRRPLNRFVSITKRDGTADLEAINNVTIGGYFAEMDIGTPGQTITFQLDTGSSDTWLNSVDTDLCNDDYLQSFSGYCMATFDPEESSSFGDADEFDFDISYLDGRRIQGFYFEETVAIGDAVIENQQLGLALESVRPTGIMGLGFSANVAALESYPTIVDNLYTQGHINSRAFSLYLNDLSASSGTILFGGIDSQKYINDLAFLDLVPDFQSIGSDITSFNVPIDGVRLSHPGGTDETSSGSATALLDSGATVCLLPDDFAQEMFERFEVETLDELPIRFVSCDWAGERGEDYEFEFAFQGKTIRVPMNEMVIDSWADSPEIFDSDPILRRLRDSLGGSVCLFGIDSIADYGISDDSVMLLGDTFLRSAYVVYDLENQQLALAQANLNSTDSNIVEIPSNSTRIPRISGVEGQEESGGGGFGNGNGSDDDDSDNNGSAEEEGGESGAGAFAPSFAMLSTALVVAAGVVMTGL
ncbi:hypothetical protein S40288_06006 [Stachybotrys chartarum IBT 40288]|nr:hypothetical protein S40288_06006 [Stachybotrys chartarum IBT 40288]